MPFMKNLRARLIERGLTRAARGDRTLGLVLSLDPPPAGKREHRFIIFSDQHKGAGDRADEFAVCSRAYTRALSHYLREGFTLILLGDVEELWENSFREVKAVHQQVIALEGSFGNARYFRVFGNHDDAWCVPRRVARHLAPLIPTGAPIYEGLRFVVMRDGAQLGTLLVLHGHQGTIDSQYLARFAEPVLRYLWRPVAQNFFGMGRQSPSSDACLRGEHDQQMYHWATRQPGLVLIAGHTHRPVWAAKTHLQILQAGLDALRATPAPRPPEWQAQVDALVREIAERTAISPPCNDGVKPLPRYFNTGCCKFSDGDITGIELVGPDISMVKWTAAGARLLLEQCPLATCY